MKKEITKTIPDYYNQIEKEEIIILLTQLANIYIDIYYTELNQD